MGTASAPSRAARYRPQLFWLAVAGLACLTPLFFVGGPGWSDGPLLKAAWNLGHPLFFALLTLTVRPWRFLSGWQLWLVTSATVLLLGVGIEYAQGYSNRNAEVHDLLRNLFGLWFVLAWLPDSGFFSGDRSRTWLPRAAAVLLVSIEVFLVAQVGLQQYRISQWLPNLYDFQQADPEPFWNGQVSATTEEHCGSLENPGLSIALSTQRYSGASLHNLPSNWLGYEKLQMVFWNPQETVIPLTLRINDKEHESRGIHHHDRFNRTYQLLPGINRISQNLQAVSEAPMERTMNMENIRRLMLFTAGLQKPARLCLTELKLTSGHDSSMEMD